MLLKRGENKVNKTLYILTTLKIRLSLIYFCDIKKGSSFSSGVHKNPAFNYIHINKEQKYESEYQQFTTTKPKPTTSLGGRAYSSFAKATSKVAFLFVTYWWN